MNRAEVDPYVSCPIIAGEYMRATGFFFRFEETTYLITARHNFLPTRGIDLDCGRVPLRYTVVDYLPEILIYLKTDTGVEIKELDERRVDGVKSSAEIGMAGVPIDFAPEQYGYQVWEPSDIVSPTATTPTVDSFGFGGEAFPDTGAKYRTAGYGNAIKHPVMLRLENELLEKEDLDSAGYGKTAVGINENFVGADEQYNGMSGAPVVGDGLIGVHEANLSPPEKVSQATDIDDFEYILYWRAEYLPELLD